MTAGGEKNVHGEPLQQCSTAPMTGYFRDGYCRTGPSDYGVHTVCARVTQEFLDYTRAQGNDLSTPHPPSFPGLRPGDGWCLCAGRWAQAYNAGKAPTVDLAATHEKTLDTVPLEHLRQDARRF